MRISGILTDLIIISSLVLTEINNSFGLKNQIDCDVSPDINSIVLTDTVKINCYVTLDCNQIIDPNKVDSLHWLLPRKLREHELIYGKTSTRVQFKDQVFTNNCGNEDNTYSITSLLTITDIGTIHNGKYYVDQSVSANVQSVNIDLDAREKGYCNFDDQCVSDNCIEQTCKCNVNEVYVDKDIGCLSVAKWNETCTNDKQCPSKVNKKSIKCLNNVCTCADGYTVGRIPLMERMCLKIASLDESCHITDQCSKAVAQSYCSNTNKCECKSGYHSAKGNCIAYKTCDSSQLNGNPNYQQAGCGKNQFCRDNICLCAPRSMENGDGSCGAPDNEKWFDKYGYYIIGCLVVLLVVTVVVGVWQVVRYRRRRALQN